jgi:uncharacterized protein YjiS (DUF1127 family)
VNMRRNQYPTKLALFEPGVQRRVTLLTSRDSENNFVPGTGISLEAFHGYQARGRQLQAQAMAAVIMGLARAASRRVKKLLAAYRQSRTRALAIRQLSAMDDRLLEDIGIRREAIPAAVAGLWQRPEVTRSSPQATPAHASQRRPAGNQDQVKAAA